MQSTRFGGEALVVEDEETVAAVVQAYLTRLGFEPTAVGLGEQAVELVRRDPDRFRLVILDLTLPDISGKEVKRRLHELGASARFVLTSGYDLANADLDGARGHVVFLHKPYDLASLRATLERALSDD